MTRLDQNRAQGQIASKLGVSANQVQNVVIWGNHSSTQFPDASHATVTIEGAQKSVPEELNDESYLNGDFITVSFDFVRICVRYSYVFSFLLQTVQKRGAAVIAARKLSSAMSAAKAAADHMRDWWNGTAEVVMIDCLMLCKIFSF